ncbi:MAG: hypothetical protein P9M14_06405 [Candidatus Alcyoniella australis]|nr:hypothetical protein [Candidatus Alcyoniella australis]
MHVSGPADSRLILVGLVHLDPEGFRRLGDLLARIQPDAVTVEASRHGLDFRVSNGQGMLNEVGRTINKLAVVPDAVAGSDEQAATITRMLGHGAIESIRRQMRIPFEVRAVRDYCRRIGANWEPIDSDEHSRRETANWSELTCPANIARLLQTEHYNLADAVRQQTKLALSALNGESTAGEPPPDLFQRDRLMAARIGELLASGPGRITHIGGWRHIIPGEPDNLLGLLAVLNPRIIMLA